jgi:Icc protein
MLIGHTHRNRVRRYAAAGDVPFAEVNNTKDYPGGFAHYRLFADGSFRQEVRRTSSSRALAHSMRCRSLFKGQYRHFTMGSLAERCYVAG